MRFVFAISVCLLALSFAPEAFADEGKVAEMRCPGTNAAFFEELNEGGWVGFGETWDFSQCGDGREIYAEGTTSRSGWRAFRRRIRPPIDEKDVEFYSKIFPIGAFGSLGLIFVVAWLLGVRHRFKKVPQVTLVCPACANTFDVAEPEYNLHSRFCPLCGAGCQPAENTEAA